MFSKSPARPPPCPTPCSALQRRSRQLSFPQHSQPLCPDCWIPYHLAFTPLSVRFPHCFQLPILFFPNPFSSSQHVSLTHLCRWKSWRWGCSSVHQRGSRCPGCRCCSPALVCCIRCDHHCWHKPWDLERSDPYPCCVWEGQGGECCGFPIRLGLLPLSGHPFLCSSPTHLTSSFHLLPCFGGFRCCSFLRWVFVWPLLVTHALPWRYGLLLAFFSPDTHNSSMKISGSHRFSVATLSFLMPPHSTGFHPRNGLYQI